MISPKLHHQATADSTVWDAFRQGSKPAFEQIYREYIQELYQYGMKIHADSPLVKDTIQNLFVELWNRRANLSSTDNIKYYLFKALRFKIYRILKLNSLQNQKKENFYQSRVIPSYETKLIGTEVLQEKKEKLSQALLQLPPRQKEVIHLLFSDQHSYEQIAEIMAINVASVYTLAWKALSTLKKLMITLLLFCWLLM